MEDEVERESESQALLERMRNLKSKMRKIEEDKGNCLLYTSPSPRDS